MTDRMAIVPRSALETLITTLRAEVERLTEDWKNNLSEARATITMWSDKNAELTRVAAAHLARADKAEAERDAAIARAEKAEAALRPFANIKMVKYSAMSSDDAWVELKGFELIDCGAFIPAKAFRDAQSALASLTEGE